jgi:hypothetical protein
VSLVHKPWALPELDISGDEGHPDWTPGEEDALFRKTGPETVELHRPPGVYASWLQNIRENRDRDVTAYEADPRSLAAAWSWLDSHPLFWTVAPGYPRNHVRLVTDSLGVARGLDLFPAAVPGGTEIRYEVMISPDLHDWELDGSCGSWEEVILEAARKVHLAHGNDRAGISVPPWPLPPYGQLSVPVHITGKVQWTGGNLEEIRAFAGGFFSVTSRNPVIRDSRGGLHDLPPGSWAVCYSPGDFGVFTDGARTRFFGKDPA